MEISEAGPYLIAALICEKVLVEKDNVPSPIRIIDRITINTITITQEGSLVVIPQVSEQEPLTLTLFISLRSGMARGTSSIKIALEEPSGLKRPPQELPVLFEGEDKGVNLILPFRLKPDPQGVYWFHISLEDQHLTRIPLRVVHQRAVLNQ